MVQIWRFDEGGPGIAYRDNDAENHGNCQLRPGTGVDLIADDKTGFVKVAYVNDGEWLAFTCRVAHAGRYRWTLLASHDGKPFPHPVALEWSCGNIPVSAPVTISDTGGFTTYRTFSGEIQLAAGIQVLQLTCHGYGMDFSDVTFTEPSGNTP